MINDFLLSLISNILVKVNYIKQDFIGLNFDINIILNFVFGFIFSIFLIILSYLIGTRIRRSIFKINIIHFDKLIDIALGYLLIGTGVTFLGFFSLLNLPIIYIYLSIIIFLSFSTYNDTKVYLKEIYVSLLNSLNEIKNNKFIFFWLTVFVSIAVITLINPEIREDQYHIDFPRMYLNEQTIMIPPMEQLHVSAAPMLSEMTYLIGIVFWSHESARYIHFIFYLLTLVTLFNFSLFKKYKFSLYTPVLFASAPVVIHETSSMYVDFQWIFMFLLSIFIVTTFKKLDLKKIIISGLLIGGMVSIKLWTIVFIPVFFLFIILKIYKPDLSFIRNTIIFLFSVLVFPSIWFLRSYLLTGNPFYPAFSSIVNLENTNEYYGLSHYVGINTSLISPISLINVFSPLFFLAIIFFFFKFFENLKFLKLNLFKFVLLILLLYFSIQYPFGRYLLGLYTVVIFFASIGIYTFKYSKIFISILLTIISLYYLISTILVLPYTLGIADKNKYLTRILSKDNSSYYDFNKKFNKFISKNDYVATYKIFGYYYADFKFIDVNFIFDKDNRLFNMFKKRGVTMVFIKDYTLNQMCNNLNIKNCDSSKYELISSYTEFPNYYLYKIR